MSRFNMGEVLEMSKGGRNQTPRRDKVAGYMPVA